MRLFTNYLFLAISILIISCNNVYSGTCKATKDGDWTDPLIWDCGHQPGNGDLAEIPVGITVKVTSNINTPSVVILIDVKGVINFKTGKFTFAAGSGVTIEKDAQLIETGGGGGSSVIKIGGTTVWCASDGNVSGPSSFGASIPLPITLAEFDASFNEEYSFVKITWETASEINNSYFEVERSYDGKIFESLVRIKGHNNSNSVLNYEYNDESYNSRSVAYYRLKQVDNNGQITYSNVEAINAITSSGLEMKVYPNPATTSNFTIAIQNTDNDIESVSVCDNYGKVLYSKKVEDSQSSIILTGEDIGKALVPGIYTIFVVSDDKLVHERLLIQ